MKYMLMMHAPRGTGDYQINNWSPEDFKAHIAFMHRFNKELTEAGELVAAEGLAAPGEAKLVRAGKNGAPVTDGPFPEIEGVPRRLLDHRRRQAGARLRARGQGSAAPGPGGTPLNMPIEVRQVMSGPPDRSVTAESADQRQRRAPAARARAAGARRRRAPSWRLRRRRGRRAGSADRGGDAVAGGRHSPQSARLALSGRHAAPHRSPAQRNGAAPPRGRSGERAAGR